jgi:hypothetical protein
MINNYFIRGVYIDSGNLNNNSQSNNIELVNNNNKDNYENYKSYCFNRLKYRKNGVKKEKKIEGAILNKSSDSFRGGSDLKPRFLNPPSRGARGPFYVKGALLQATKPRGGLPRF